MLDSTLNIEVAISTLNDGIYNPKFRDDFNYLIIHQISNDVDYSDYIQTLPKNVRYIKSNTVGLSKSRNLAIENTNAEYLWIMDDDVGIHDSALIYVEDYLKKHPKLSMLVVSHSHEEIEYLPGNKEQNINKISAASISSIDMIIKVDLLNGIRFNENFGLGAKYVSGEEYIFACNLLDKGKEIIKTRKVCTYHPLISSGQDFYSTPMKLKTKLEMFKAANGLIRGNLLYVLFCIKKIKIIYKKNAIKNVIKSFV
ncbi:glycosyltransferase family 2 protein [Photobacterium piscicola]|uniref:glycosyltransferase family 2 protein n=1 Tax=Photobacterium piscicola TaxID=1378299 RepID=UPI0038D10664